MAKKFAGMTQYEIGQELWAMAGDMNIAETVEDYGGVLEAAGAAIEVLSDADTDFDGLDPERCIQVYLESELGI